ncbi:ribbon-helix-helix domain-containing protein [Streptomyces sp. NPDC001978]|uniref:ribbon-helix-helix domain-containing protein n=1 Tax=Streptomyces sp. NPDC001978 TaxID=3364627 RepID=UPI003682312A
MRSRDSGQRPQIHPAEAACRPERGWLMIQRFSARLHEPEAEALLTLADDSGESPNVLMRRAIREYVQRAGVLIPPYADGTPCEAP